MVIKNKLSKCLESFKLKLNKRILTDKNLKKIYNIFYSHAFNTKKFNANGRTWNFFFKQTLLKLNDSYNGMSNNV